MTSGRLARLAHPRVKPDIGDELLRCLKATDVADHRHERRGRDEAHPGDSHEAADLLRRKRLSCERSLDQPNLSVEEVDLAQSAVDGLALVGRQLERLEPLASSLAEHVTHRRATFEVAGEHG